MDTIYKLINYINEGNLTKFRSLLPLIVDINRLCDGETLLYIAVDIYTSHGGTTSTKLTRFQMIEELLNRGADPNILSRHSRVSEERTPLHTALRREKSDVVTLLLNAPIKADPNLADTDGKSPLFFAVDNNDLDTVKQLLNAGADAQLSTGFRLPLLSAVICRNIEMVKVLLDAGSINPTGKTTESEIGTSITPIYFAITNNLTDIVELLENYTPSLQTCTIRSVKLNLIDVSQLPPIIFP